MREKKNTQNFTSPLRERERESERERLKKKTVKDKFY